MKRGRLPEAVIFDMDGLMFDTEKISHEGFVKGFGKIGCEFPTELSQALQGSNMTALERMVDEYYERPIPLDKVMRVRRKYFDDYIRKHGLPVKPGLSELLDFLASEHIGTAIASSNDRDKIDRNLRLAGLEDYFNTIISGEDIVESKPDPEIFLKAAGELGVAPENCLVLEDTPRGAEAAEAAGIPVILVPDMISPDGEAASRAEAVLKDLFQVREYLAAAEEGKSA